MRAALKASSLVGLVLVASCTSYYEVPIETPIRPTLDVSAFDRVLVAGFLGGGTKDIDANLETTRLLRSQLRNQSRLRVIDSDVVSLLQVSANELIASGAATLPENLASGDAPTVTDEDDLEPYEHIFADVEYWRALGEEHQNPLIVTGSVLFTPFDRNGLVQSDREVFDTFGRRSVVPVRQFVERTGFNLRSEFIFIDGRTGVTLYSETFTEQALYNLNQSIPALASYFELMDRMLPNFLNTLSTQSVRGTRILLN